jgi:hypothetical protein
MYLGSVVIWLSAPWALGSYLAWPAFILLIPFYVFRLLNRGESPPQGVVGLFRILPSHPLPARPLHLVRPTPMRAPKTSQARVIMVTCAALR